MSVELVNHNDDIRRLLEKGYAIRIDGAYLVVRDIPYLDSQKAFKIGAIVTKLEMIDRVRVKQHNHQVFFAGSSPCGLDGRPIPNLGDSPATLKLSNPDVIVERQFSNKPKANLGSGQDGFADFFDKIEHYVRMISGPAIELHGANPYTYRADEEVAVESVFKFRDTLTSRAEIGDLAAAFKDDVVAVIGLGGTGSYLLDFLVKTPVKEIRAFDHDFYYVHNAFRSPGRLDERDLGQRKAAVYRARYDNFRSGLTIESKRLDRSSSPDLEGVTFAFVCVDKGSARAELFDLLINMDIPFIDVGMGLERKRGALSGMLRATYYAAGDGPRVRDMQLAEMTDDTENIYKTDIQISELNALNACLAVVRYKQTKGFYVSDAAVYHMVLEIGGLRTFPEATP